MIDTIHEAVVAALLVLVVAGIIGAAPYTDHVQTLRHIEAGHCKYGTQWMPCQQAVPR